MEGPLTQHGAQTREVVIEGIQHAEPVAAAVDFEAFDRGQTIIGLDIFSIRSQGHSIGTGQRLENGTRHTRLDFEKRHNVTRAGACRYFSALSASA